MQLQQLIERSAFVRSRRNGSSTVDQDGHAEPKISAGAAELVENSRDSALTRYCRFCSWAFYKVANFVLYTGRVFRVVVRTEARRIVLAS